MQEIETELSGKNKEFLGKRKGMCTSSPLRAK